MIIRYCGAHEAVVLLSLKQKGDKLNSEIHVHLQLNFSLKENANQKHFH